MQNVFVWYVKCISSFLSQLTNEQVHLPAVLPPPLSSVSYEGATKHHLSFCKRHIITSVPMSFSALVAQLYNVSLEEHIGKGFLQLFSYISSDWQNCTVVSIWSDSGSHFEIMITYVKKIFAQRCYLWKSCIVVVVVVVEATQISWPPHHHLLFVSVVVN